MQSVLFLIVSLACISSSLGFGFSPGARLSRSGVSGASSMSMVMYKTKAERDAAMTEKKAKGAVKTFDRKTTAAAKVRSMIGSERLGEYGLL